MDIDVKLTYLGLREGEWRHHAYTASVTFEGRTEDFPYATGTGWHREPEQAWIDSRKYGGLGLPDYLSKDGPTSTDPKTGLGVYPKRQRDRFHRERDEKLVAGVLESLAMDLSYETESDDDLASDLDMKPSDIAYLRGVIARIHKLFGRHTAEFEKTYREE